METLKIALLLIYSGFFFCITSGQDKTDKAAEFAGNEETKKGFGYGGSPVLGYNSDIGFQYGVIVNLFNYGDGTLYPDYKYTLYTEISRTTKGGGINQLFFDSKYLIPGNIRITADLSYLTELSLNFYGFNGYESIYNPGLETENDPEYISRVYYRHQRKFIRFSADFQGKLSGQHLLWFGGIGYFDFKIATVDIDKLNKGKTEEDKLPDVELLYDNYVESGIINANEKNGGSVPSLKGGFVFDSRDIEANPMKGIWTEAILFYSPAILGNKNYSYAKISIIHRQYFTLIKNKLSFVYRLGYQGTIAGNEPFFMRPYMISSFTKNTITDGLGGAKTLRGILRNRVVGNGIIYGNIELRWKFVEFRLWNQDFYLAINAFGDAGQVVKKVDVPSELWNNLYPGFSSQPMEGIHFAFGGGFRIAWNQNFILAIDYGTAADHRDGIDGLYVGIGYLF